MRILYIFPHPDDESFGPAPVIKAQVDQGHEVFLLTLTRGGATKVRHKLELSVSQMGEIRYQEMLKVQKVLQLKGMTVLDLPDDGLKELDPREIEKVAGEHIEKIQPQIIVTYPVHGVSGFHDHLVTHAVVKRVYLELRDQGESYLKRLAFITIPNKVTEPVQAGNFVMKQSDPSLIDCEVALDSEAQDVLKAALSCYETYREIVEKSGVIQRVGDKVYFEIFGEDHKPPLSDLTAGIEMK
ncbi:PIG-L family deacetylase [bacterium]|nr:PIG-L family deacetylase [bacterium]MCI0614906.1 PIG-L family deacetylase [bacterium]